MSAPAARWLDRAPADWDALVAGDPSASPSHRPGLWNALAAVLPGRSPRVLAIEEGGALVGGVPAVEFARGPLRWLYALPQLLPAPPLARPGRHAEIDAIAAGAFAALAHERGTLGGSWSWYRPAGPAPAGGSLERVPGETRFVEAAVVDLAGGIDAAFRKVGRKERAALHGIRARSASFAEAPHELEAAWGLHATQSRRWSGHAPQPLELSRRLLAEGVGAPVARLFALRDRRGIVSGALALDGPHETFVWWSGTHADGRTSGASALLLWRIVEWAAAAGRARVNLGASAGLAGVASFKRSLGAEGLRYPVRWLDASHAGALGRCVAGVQAIVRRGRPRGESA